MHIGSEGEVDLGARGLVVAGGHDLKGEVEVELAVSASGFVPAGPGLQGASGGTTSGQGDIGLSDGVGEGDIGGEGEGLTVAVLASSGGLGSGIGALVSSLVSEGDSGECKGKE